MEPYQGLADCGEVDHDSDIYQLSADNIQQYNSVIIIVNICPGSELGIFGIAIVDKISRRALVGFGLLRASV